MKVIGHQNIIEDSFKAYNLNWDISSLKLKKDPILMVVTGSMNQQPILSGFLGRAVEEKFYLEVIALRILPCIPLVSETLKNMVHPDIGPAHISRGVREGYFYVNLSTNQNFENGPEFYSSNAVDEELGKLYCHTISMRLKSSMEFKQMTLS